MDTDFLTRNVTCSSGYFEFGNTENIEILGLKYVDNGVMVICRQQSASTYKVLQYTTMEHVVGGYQYLNIDLSMPTELPQDIDIVVCEGFTVPSLNSDFDNGVLTIKTAEKRTGSPTIEIKNVHRNAIPIHELPVFCSNNPEKRFHQDIIQYIKTNKHDIFGLLPAHLKLLTL